MNWEMPECADFNDGRYKWLLAGKEELINNPLFEGYTFCDPPRLFEELFQNQNYNVVELVSINKLVKDGKGILDPGRFVGAFAWTENKLDSLDGDYYETDMSVYGFLRFAKPEAGVLSGLSILVGNDW